MENGKGHSAKAQKLQEPPKPRFLKPFFFSQAGRGQGRSLFSWCLYDWANTAFGTVVITFVFSVYFTTGLVGDDTKGAALWSYAIAVSGVVIAVFAPLLGAVADHSGARKRWIFWFSLLCITATALLFFAAPAGAPGNILIVLALVVLASIGFELAQVFYNAMLPHIAPPRMIGRISGWGWGLGYAGGLACLGLTLFGLVGVGEIEPFLPVSGAESANIRASAPLTALWFAVFMLPLFIFTRDEEGTPLPFMQSLRSGTAQLFQTLRQTKQHKNLILFLVSSALYRDGLVTLFSIGGVYAAGQLGMNFQEIIFFAIGLNVTAGLGALVFAHIDDWLGSKITVMISLYGLVLSGLAILMTADKDVFMVLAMILGIFIGPAQAASRTLAGRLAPPGMVTQTYGLYAFTGKSAAFLGPLAYGLATSFFDNQQAGMMSIVVFWITGLVLLAMVREK